MHLIFPSATAVIVVTTIEATPSAPGTTPESAGAGSNKLKVGRRFINDGSTPTAFSNLQLTSMVKTAFGGEECKPPSAERKGSRYPDQGVLASQCPSPRQVCDPDGSSSLGGRCRDANAGIASASMQTTQREPWRILQEGKGPQIDCDAASACPAELCTCAASTEEGYPDAQDCAAELNAVCTTGNTEQCFDYENIDFYDYTYCPFAACYLEGNDYDECACGYYQDYCELYRAYIGDAYPDIADKCTVAECCDGAGTKDERVACIPEMMPSAKPSASPSETQSEGPTASPTRLPTQGPTKNPTKTPVESPSGTPTKQPTTAPVIPNDPPTSSPSKRPTEQPMEPSATNDPPTKSPSEGPKKEPPKKQPMEPPAPNDPPTSSPSATKEPTEPNDPPTISPSKGPTGQPTDTSVSNDSLTESPSEGPKKEPTKEPTEPPMPNDSPTNSPSATKEQTENLVAKNPTDDPMKNSTGTPTMNTTDTLTKGPASQPTESPTKMPTGSPTKKQTDAPTESPTATPTSTPIQNPTGAPTTTPTQKPTAAVPNPTSKPTEGTLASSSSEIFEPPAPENNTHAQSGMGVSRMILLVGVGAYW
eukprot:CAMPEP_0181108210 /NCGR_PEP_ID=MMETSP1071-20121207/17509_1 /TAXON_ID=35127 /ORGANISM="Thalassiosira sp., Strain NH16" /LENGTH=591 /DNA_ID=CAMNT_0023191799 /DNA_START=111 /DNA_END=1883 /DNA_ORIENTATION=+